MPPEPSVFDADRPRERLARTSASSLGDAELLALVIGHGLHGHSALEIATALLLDVGGIHGLARARRTRLARIKGVGDAQASRIVASVELGRRTLTVAAPERLTLDSPAALGQFLLPRYGAHPVERFGVVLLDARSRLIDVHLVTEGSLDRSLALPRDVFREAAVVGAAAIALFHNHPSGDPSPTRADVELTRRLADAGRVLDIPVVDHLILADTAYCSLRQAHVF